MGIDWYLKSIGIGAFALAILGLAYGLVMWGYFGLRKKWPYQKYLPEIIIVFVTLILSIVFKGIMVGKYGGAEGDTCKPAYVITRAIYDAFGGFTFEGLAFDINDKSTEISILLYSFYVGTTLLSAVVAFSVVTAKVSYEIYSRLRICKIVRFFQILFAKEIDTYIFTGLTNETLELAKSIANQESDNNEPRKKRIIFTGDDIPDFDRDNELCRKVMEHDFLYISGNGNKQQSIAARLHLNKKNSKGRFVVFSFVADQHIPAEETNMDIVVSDVKARIHNSKKTKKSKKTKNKVFKDGLCIEYFILTKRDINYQAYQSIYDMLYDEYLKNEVKKRTTKVEKQINTLGKWTKKENKKNRRIEKRINKIVINIQKVYEKCESYQSDFAKTLSLDPKDKNVAVIQSELLGMLNKVSQEYFLEIKEVASSKEEFSSSVAFNVWNEANAIADSMASFLNDKFATSNDKCVYVWSLGFGQTAQAICKELYVQTARIDDQGKASEFFVDAFDTNTKDIGGILAYEEPMSIYLDKEDYFFSAEKESTTIEGCTTIGDNSKVDEDKKQDNNKSAKMECEDERNKKILRYVKRQVEIEISQTKEDISKTKEDICQIEEDIFKDYLYIQEQTTQQNKLKELVKLVKQLGRLVKRLGELKSQLKELKEYECQKKDIDYDLISVENNICQETKCRFAEWEKEYRPFAVNLHDISCLDKKFLKSADGYTGLAKSVDRAPQYIVVATGDDYRNIRIVNAMVFDVLNEKERVNTSGKPQVIFVNVWDGKNNDLINTYDIGERQDDPDKSCQVIEFKNSKKSKPYLYVVILGNNDQIYSNSMLSYEDYAKFHEQYELATKDLKQEEIVVKEKNIYEMLSKENRFQLTPKEVNNIVDNIKKLESKEIDFIKSMPKKYNIFNINEIKTIKSLPEKKIKVFESLTIADIDNIIEKYKENPVFKLTEIKKIVPKCKYLSKKDILLICQLENIGLTSKDIVKVLLLKDEEIEKYNTIYSKLDETQFKIIQELSLEQIQNIEKKDHINEYVKEKCNKLLESMNTESGIKNQPQDKSQLRNMWNALSLWDKKSNADVYFYSNVFYKAMNEVEKKDAVQQYNTFTRLLIQEHQRWMRLHFVHGWEYGEKIKKRRMHDCLCPYIFVDSKNCRYDMFNVMLSKAIIASKPQTSDNNPEPNNTNQENSQGKKQ